MPSHPSSANRAEASAMAAQARAVAEGLRLQGPSGLRSTTFLERLEAGQPHMMLVHSFGGDGSVWLCNRLRKLLKLNGKSPLYPPSRLVDCLSPLELAKLQEYTRHFVQEGQEELLNTLRLNTGMPSGEWFVTYSVGVGSGERGRWAVVTLLRPLSELLQEEGKHETEVAAAPTPPPASPLSERERQVLALIAQGMRSRDIAERLHISPLTVKSHRQSLMLKLGAHNAAGLVRASISMGQ